MLLFFVLNVYILHVQGLDCHIHAIIVFVAVVYIFFLFHGVDLHIPVKSVALAVLYILPVQGLDLHTLPVLLCRRFMYPSYSGLRPAHPCQQRCGGSWHLWLWQIDPRKLTSQVWAISGKRPLSTLPQTIPYISLGFVTYQRDGHTMSSFE